MGKRAPATSKMFILLLLILICILVDILLSHFKMMTGNNTVINMPIGNNHILEESKLKFEIAYLHQIIENQTLQYNEINSKYNAFVLKENLLIPKIIWILWFQGWENAPIVPKIALHSWKKFNAPNWIIITLDDHNLQFYVQSYHYYKQLIFSRFSASEKYRHATLSDIMRIELLNKYGGVWVDSTVICTQPLNEWLFDYVNDNGFFAFDKPGKNGIFSSWFLSSSLNQSYIVKQWNINTHIYWRNQQGNKLQHFWFFDVFKKLYKSDAKFKNNWKNTKVFSAFHPHMLRHSMFRMTQINITDEIKEHIDHKKAPMYKLDKNITSYLFNSSTGYLFNKYNFTNYRFN